VDTRVKLILVVCGVIVAFASFAGGTRSDERPDSVALYGEKPDHLWNRVHAALLVRTGPDDKEYGHDRLEPLLWTESEYLQKGKSSERAVAVLEEFDRAEGETLIDDPVKRAVLQRDLWLVSSWLSNAGRSHPRLVNALDKAILRLALSPKQIAKLPDNYAVAVAAKKYVGRFDPEKPERSYLPPDLFEGEGPWVCVGPADGLAAPFHYNTPFNNSVFFVFLKLPGGRERTLDFLKRLGALNEVLVPNKDEQTRRTAPLLPHPDFPAWPKGTEVALVRRALVIDSERRVLASPLTESVQIRAVTAETPALTKDVLEKAASRRPPAEWQASFEFQLRRADLFAGTAGGLRDVSGERDFKTGFNSHGWDEFDIPLSKDRPFPDRSQPFTMNRTSCASCHNFPGAYGFNSVPGFEMGLRTRLPDADAPLKRPPGPTTVPEVEKRAIKWKERQPAWTAFIKRSGR
jgi:hypothetical protein